jgi:hypothetical protein
MSRARFEPAIRVFERLKAVRALDRTAVRMIINYILYTVVVVVVVVVLI